MAFKSVEIYTLTKKKKLEILKGLSQGVSFRNASDVSEFETVPYERCFQENIETYVELLNKRIRPLLKKDPNIGPATAATMLGLDPRVLHSTAATCSSLLQLEFVNPD